MSLDRAIVLKKEELGQCRLERSEAELRARVRDLRPTANLEGLLKREDSRLQASTSPGSRLVLLEGHNNAAEAYNPFSIEGVILANLRDKDLEQSLKAPRLTLIPELKRRALPNLEPAVPERFILDAERFYLPRPDVELPMLAVWTDRAFFGSRLEDLETLSRWYQQRREDLQPPVLIRADLPLAPYHVFEARVSGAGALLVIVDALGHHQLEDVLGYCAELGLSAICYVSSVTQAERILRQGVRHLAVGEYDLFAHPARLPERQTSAVRLLQELPREVLAMTWGIPANKAQLDLCAHAGAVAAVLACQAPEVREPVRWQKETPA